MGTEIETLGKYQIRLSALEAEAQPGWDAFLTVMYFKDEIQDFACVLEKLPVPEGPFPSYQAAIDAARVFANTLLEKRTV